MEVLNRIDKLQSMTRLEKVYVTFSMLEKAERVCRRYPYTPIYEEGCMGWNILAEIIYAISEGGDPMIALDEYLRYLEETGF